MKPYEGQRVRYFDLIKGVAIFMVVMGHVITFGIRGIDYSATFKFIGAIHMPLFFFVSGWFSYKMSSSGTFSRPNLGKRAIRLLVPMVTVSALWLWAWPYTRIESPLPTRYVGLWLDPWKGGYWFTFVLFEINVIYAVTLTMINRMKTVLQSVVAIMLVWAAIIGMLYIIPARAANLLSLFHVASYFPVYMLGVMCSRHKEAFYNILDNSWLQTATILVMAVTIYLISWPWEIGLDGLSLICVTAIFQISLVPVTVAVFKRWDEKASSPQAGQSARFFSRMWAYVGQQSLAIYLLHYFFLFPMGDLFRSSLESLGVGFVPMLVFTTFWSAAIVACVLAVVKLLEPSRQLSFLMTGKPLKTNKS